jgi:hypothetical protein
VVQGGLESGSGAAVSPAGELCGSLADPVLIGDGAPAGCAELACAAHAACLLEPTQQQEHLTATRTGSFGEVRGGQAVAVGQQLPGGLGRQGLSRQGFLSVFCRRRLSGFGLDAAVDGLHKLLE